MSQKIKTRFLILSDTHARAPNPATATSKSCRWPLPLADVAIHTGDLTLNGKLSEHQQAVDLLKRLRADLKIVIPGNHDLTLDTSYYAELGYLHGPYPRYTDQQLQQIRDLYTSRAARDANIVYLEEGMKTFQLKNGAKLTIYASAYTPEFCQWAFAYEREDDRFNSLKAKNPIPSYLQATAGSTNIDVMLTHGPPMGILDNVENKGQNKGQPKGDIHVGCEHLLRGVARAKPLLHCFGHIHEGGGAVRKRWSEEADSTETISIKDALSDSTKIDVDDEKAIIDMGVEVDGTSLQRGKETLFVNASIMDLRYNPVQSPWIVDLMLDKHD